MDELYEVREKLRLPLWFILVATILFGCPTSASADPLYQAITPQGVTITLHSGNCAVKEVSNLPKAAEWRESGKTYKGCWGVSPLGIVMLYFQEDKTVAIVPAEYFQKVHGT